MRKNKFAILALSLLVASAAVAATISDNELFWGTQNDAVTKTMKVGNGQIKWDGASAKWTFSNDGANFKAIGSGSGGAAGFSLLADDNPDFESGTSLWTNSGGGATFVAITSGQAFGAQSGRWNSSAASQTLSSASKTIVDGLKGKNGVGILYAKTLATDYKLQVFDGTVVLAERAISASTTYDPVAVNFIFPSSGTVRLRLISASDAADIDVDNAYLGEATNLFQFSQAMTVAEMYFAATANCNWNNANTGSFGDFTVDTDCPGPSVGYSSGIGTPATTDTDLPQVTINNLPAGVYYVQVTGQVYPSTNGHGTAIRLHDGATAGNGYGTGETELNQAAGTAVATAIFNYSSAGNRTFKVQGINQNDDMQLDNQGTYQRTYFVIKRFPNSTELALKPDAAAWHIDANQGGANPGLSLVDQATYVNIEDAALDTVTNSAKGSAQALQACAGVEVASGTTCSGNETVGLAFTIPRAGLVEVCLDFPWSVNMGASSASAVTFQLVETPNNAQTISQEGGVRNQSFLGNGTGGGAVGLPQHHCGAFKFDSAGMKTVRLFYESDYTGTISSSQIVADRSATNGQEDIRWTARYVDQNQPMPVIVNSVVSDSSGVEKVLRGRLALNGATCTFVSQSGGFASASRTGSGRCQLAVTAGVFSAAPTCVASVDQPSAGTDVIAFVAADTALSATNVHIGIADTAATPVDQSFAVICMGPK